MNLLSASIMMAIGAANDTESIRKLRTVMLSGLKTTFAAFTHKFEKIYYLEGDANKIMLHGTTDFELHNGERIDDVPFAIRASFESGDRLRLSLYQVRQIFTP
jgi:hypothetical protein